MISIRRVAATGMVALAVSAGGLTISASPAAAVPNSCSERAQYGYSGWWSVACYGGSGQYQAVVSCSSYPGGTSGIRHLYEGVPWGVGSNRVSVAQCGAAHPYMRQGWTRTWD